MSYSKGVRVGPVVTAPKKEKKGGGEKKKNQVRVEAVVTPCSRPSRPAAVEAAGRCRPSGQA